MGYNLILFRLKKKILCFLGWHGWVWSVGKHGWGVNGNPPNEALCEHCGIKYKKGN